MEKSEIVFSGLKSLYPNAECELEYKDAYSLLIAVILSAQCTDKRVNQVMPTLLKRYPTVYDLANAGSGEVEDIIRSCGFYKNKTKSIIECSKDIVEKYNGEVPNSLDELIKLRGVGRKTANVVLSTVFKTPAIAVDTHVFRVANRLGLVKADNVEDCEKQLMKALPKERWSEMHQMLVLFGRYKCKAIKPNCIDCPLKDSCDKYNGRISIK